MSLFSRTVLALTGASPVERLLTGTRPGKSLASRFVAGDNLDEATVVANRLNAEGFNVSLDLLGEEVHDRGSAKQATREYLDCIDRIESDGLAANISVKPTQLGLAIDETLALEAIVTLARRADEAGTTVTIDMEDSRYTEATIKLFEKAQTAHGNAGIALQSYLHRTPNDLERCLPLGGHIRLCKGAYAEPESVAIQSDGGIEAAYAAQLRVLMESPTSIPAVATHDGKLIDLARELARHRERPFEFQMLFGVRPELQRHLIDEGFPLRIYLPFGSQWYPYLTRRLAERPANAIFFARAVLGR